MVSFYASPFGIRERRPELQRAEPSPHGLSKADPILAWGWYVLTPTILSIKSKSTKSTNVFFTPGKVQ